MDGLQRTLIVYLLLTCLSGCLGDVAYATVDRVDVDLGSNSSAEGYCSVDAENECDDPPLKKLPMCPNIGYILSSYSSSYRNPYITSNIYEAKESVEKCNTHPNPYPLSLDVCTVGGHGGQPFGLYANHGDMLKQIKVWVSGSTVKSVQVWFTDGRTQKWGHRRGEEYKSHKFTFKPGELITSMSLWGNGVGTRLGAIKFETNKSNRFFAKMTEWSLRTEYLVDTGSGVCTGVVGGAKESIDRMGFVFMKRISHSEMTNLQYPSIGFEEVKVKATEIRSVISNVNFQFQASFEKKAKESWSVPYAIGSAFRPTIISGFPKLAEAEVGWTLRVSSPGKYKMENYPKTKLKWTFPIIVPTHTTVKANLSIGQTAINLPYKATVHITTMDGNHLTFNVAGDYEGVSYTQPIFSVTRL